MILVADSGSTKADWKGYASTGISSFHTQGLNPYFVNSQDVVKILNKNNDLLQFAEQVKEIYFFGAGCSTPDKHEVITNGLSVVFPNAFISVDHDLIGSAYATCGDKKGLSCILGTGSSIAYYDGKEVQDGKHGLGYVLGDEGSGTFFGRKMLTTFLYNTMPTELRDAFFDDYKVDKETVVTNVYQKPFPNSYLAEFSRFMKNHQSHPFIQKTLIDGFQEFVDSNIKDYKQHRSVACNFVGSIAFHYQEELKQVLASNGLKIGNILQKPIDGIFDYILRKEGIITS